VVATCRDRRSGGRSIRSWTPQGGWPPGLSRAAVAQRQGRDVRPQLLGHVQLALAPTPRPDHALVPMITTSGFRDVWYYGAPSSCRAARLDRPDGHPGAEQPVEGRRAGAARDKRAQGMSPPAVADWTPSYRRQVDWFQRWLSRNAGRASRWHGTAIARSRHPAVRDQPPLNQSTCRPVPRCPGRRAAGWLMALRARLSPSSSSTSAFTVLRSRDHPGGPGEQPASSKAPP